MGMTVGSGKGSLSEPNIVPLIDVLLVLIIIFMVITPTVPQGLDARIPQPAQPTEHRDKDEPLAAIVVQVTSSGNLLINQDFLGMGWGRAWKISSSSARRKRPS